LTETPEESAVRLGPAAANLLRSIWRQRQLVALGLVLGVALGYLALPKVLGSSSTYQASVRMAIYGSPVDGISPLPAYFTAVEGQGGTSTDALKDIAIAEQVLKKTAPDDSELTATQLLDRLGFSPVAGTPYVDVSFADGRAQFAAAVVKDYADRLAGKQNAQERKRYQDTIASLERFQGSSAQEAAIDGKRAELEFAYAQWPGNSVVSDKPVVTTFGPPLSRSVTLALGLLFGLAIGAGAGLLVETAFRKVIAPSDAEEATGLPFIAAVRKTGTRRTPLPVADRPFSPAAEDYRRVGTALERQGLGSDIKVLTIASADPGDGKTMLAANLAHSLARQGRAVVLVSSDLRQPQVEKLLGVGQLPGLAEALQDDPLPAIALLVSINDHLLVLPAGLPNKHPGELLASKRLYETIQTLRQMGIVILDSPPARLSADAIALSAVADATLIVARSGVTRVRSLREVTAGLRRDRVRQLGVVLVGTSSSMLRSRRLDGYREPEFEADELEPMAPPPRPVPFAPKQVRPPGPGGNGDGQADADLQERDRRAVE
jgi:Mrp family chromosome partitioning ATPase/capsular polysaccharide biosynthesis protein